ncbi:MAG: hypothetical protein RIC03_18810 [Cyclobacteriaceae bacterium]
MIDKKQLLKLAEIHQPNCISIYFRMEGHQKNHIILKNLIQEAEKILDKAYGLDDKEISERLKPIYDLLDNEKWMSKPDGEVAILIYGEDYEIIECNGAGIKSEVRVSDHLYLAPLTPLVSGAHQIYLMTLSANKVKLYEVDDYQIKESDYSSYLPKNIESVVGGDVEQKSLQNRSGQQGGSGEGSMYHGHGAGNDSEKKLEYEKFFREIDTQLNAHITDQSLPLVIACVDYLFPIYQEINNYQKLHKHFISGNFDEVHANELYEEGKKIIDQLKVDDLKERKSNFEGLLAKQQASTKVQDVVPSSFEGKIESLFIKENFEIFGRYLKNEHKIEIDSVNKLDNASLINMAAMNTTMADGSVFIVPDHEMPVKEADICAVYRYNEQD